MKELRVYIIPSRLVDGDINNLSNEDFIDIAEMDGEVYSLEGFQRYWNSRTNLFDFNSEDTYLRIL